MILFLAQFPTSENIKDGMVQRIQSIDSFFQEDQRTYLSASFRRFIKKEVIQDGKVTVIRCNALLHFFLIWGLFVKAKAVYIHSVFNALPNIIPIFLFKKNYTLDAHGVVPEEFELNGQNVYSRIYGIIERTVFLRAKNVICVTKSMCDYFKSKYTGDHNYIVYTIMPTNLKGELKISENDQKPIIIYSGNTQKWQNVDLMCQVIQKNISEKIRIIILTGEVDEMNSILDRYNLRNHDNLEVASVLPHELAEYYTKANYGFILRDDIVVNNVACPTKMIEYLYYGITPIVLSENIGDFKQYNYEYRKYQDLETLKPIKSLHNREIAEMLKDKNDKVNIRKLII